MQYVTKAGIRSLSVALGLVAFSPAASADGLRIGGTGVALGGMSLLAEAFEAAHPDTEIEVLPSLGSSGGVKALLAGAIDLSVSSRALKDAETEKGAIARLYATTPLAVVTSTGTDAAPYFRIFNPDRQAERFDKEHEYIRTWVPEFGTAAASPPIVDLKQARARAIETFKTAKNHAP